MNRQQTMKGVDCRFSANTVSACTEGPAVEAALDLCRKHAPKPPSSSARNYFRQFAAQFYYIATGKRSELDHQIRRALQKSDRRV